MNAQYPALTDSRYRFKSGSTTLVDGATSITITGYDHYITANTGNTEIVAITGGAKGMSIFIHANDNFTSIANNAAIKLQSGHSIAKEDFPIYSTIELWYDGSIWIQQGLHII